MIKAKRVLALCLLGFFPLIANAEPKNLSIQDIEFTTITTKDNADTVRARILMQSQQFESIRGKSLKVEVRFYSGEQKGQEKRIMDKNRYFLASPITSFDLSPKEACPSAGNYSAKIWLSVRNNDRSFSPNDGYENYEERYSYTCVDRKKLKSIRATSEFKLATPNGQGRTFSQLNLILSVDSAQYASVSQAQSSFEVRLYTYRDDQTFRVSKDKTYLMKSAKSSFSFNVKDLCGEMQRTVWDDLFDRGIEKEVEVGCRTTVVKSNGNRDSQYDEYTCPSVKLICYK